MIEMLFAPLPWTWQFVGLFGFPCRWRHGEYSNSKRLGRFLGDLDTNDDTTIGN